MWVDFPLRIPEGLTLLSKPQSLLGYRFQHDWG